MNEYLKTGALACGALAIFGIAILVVGYKPASIGRVMTIILLAAGSIACTLVGRKKARSQQGDNPAAL